MKSMHVFSLKVFGSPAFSVGSLFMYEKVDLLLDITSLVEASGIKLKGVPLAQLVKAIVAGVLNGKRSVNAIYDDIHENGAAKYVGEQLDAASKRNLFRAIEKLGSKKGKKLYEAIVNAFQEKTGFDFSQTNLDFSSSFFFGNKCKLAKLGYSRDHRPDKPQIKLGLVQCGKQLIPFQYEVDEGNLPDVKQFQPIFKSIKDRLPKGSLIVFDKGANSNENLKLVAEAGHYYLTAEKMTAKMKRKIKTISKQCMEKMNNGTRCLVEETSEGRKFYYYSEKLAKQQKQRRARRIAEEIKAAKQLQKKMQGKAFKRKKTETKLCIAELEEERIVTETSIQKRLITKPLKQIRKELKAKGKELDGWFVLTTNKKLSSKQALKRYRKKDTVEKLICSLKQNCKLRPFNVRKNECVKGSVFISKLAAFVLGCFQWINKPLRNKSHKNILEIVKRLTLALKLNRLGKIVGLIALNVNDFLKKTVSPTAKSNLTKQQKQAKNSFSSGNATLRSRKKVQIFMPQTNTTVYPASTFNKPNTATKKTDTKIGVTQSSVKLRL